MFMRHVTLEPAAAGSRYTVYVYVCVYIYNTYMYMVY